MFKITMAVIGIFILGLIIKNSFDDTGRTTCTSHEVCAKADVFATCVAHAFDPTGECVRIPEPTVLVSRECIKDEQCKGDEFCDRANSNSIYGSCAVKL
jgi:hypothetical protein